MKKILVFMILCCLIFSTACSSNNDSDNEDYEKTSVTETEEKDTFIVTSAYDAKAIAEEYVSDNPSTTIRGIVSSPDFHSYSSFRVGSSEITEIKNPDYDYSYYLIDVKGSFYGYDAYGNSMGRYNYEAKVKVYAVDGNAEISFTTLIDD